MNQRFIYGSTAVILIMVLIIAALLSSIYMPVGTKDVRQYIDHDAQGVCYILENGNGISCLPINEVNIGE
jgi:cation transport ATPase